MICVGILRVKDGFGFLLAKALNFFFCIKIFSPKRKWQDENLATNAESFPRIPVTPPEGEITNKL